MKQLQFSIVAFIILLSIFKIFHQVNSLPTIELEGFKGCHISTIYFDLSSYEHLPSPTVLLSYKSATNNTQFSASVNQLESKWNQAKIQCALFLANYTENYEEIRSTQKTFITTLTCHSRIGFKMETKGCYVRHIYYISSLKMSLQSGPLTALRIQLYLYYLPRTYIQFPIHYPCNYTWKWLFHACPVHPELYGPQMW